MKMTAKRLSFLGFWRNITAEVLAYGFLKLFVLMAGLALLHSLAGCAPAAAPPLTAEPPQQADPRALIKGSGRFFSTSGECAFCHTALQDAQGRDVSIDAAWRSTMMANAGRDPYYLASVRHEVEAHPRYAAVVQEKCAVCHLPMAAKTDEIEGVEIQMLDEGYLDPAHPYHLLALDGVSCTVCHQIQAEGLGSLESFSGGFDVDSDTAAGQRLIFGRYEVSEQAAALMQNVSGFIPQQADHVTRSEVCAVCHNLYTPHITAAGQISEELFPEQTPQIEWLNSAYVDQKSCQDCHMPAAGGEIAIANVSALPRPLFRQHIFAGGNVYMQRILMEFGDQLGVTAGNEHFEATILQTLDLLQEQTAEVKVEGKVDGQELAAIVEINVGTGHKFPTSFPSRRAWLHLRVEDASGSLIFESGGYDEKGMIAGNENDLDPARFEPHYDVITLPGQVQIYEPIIGDPGGQVTTTLLSAKSYLKDNRLLPVGFDKAGAPPDVAVVGEARQDESFSGGQDRVTYRIPVDGAGAPYTVTVELLYQSIGYRWIENLREQNSQEAEDFFQIVDYLPTQPVVIAAQVIQVSPQP